MDWLTPTLGLVGVIGAALIAYAQFRRGERNKVRSEFESARAKTLDTLFSAVSELELRARKILGEGLTPVEREHFLGEVAEQKRNVNELIIRHRDTLSSEDATAARSFVEAIEHLSVAIADAPAVDRESLAITASEFVEPDVVKAFRELTRSHEHLATQLRKARGGPAKLP